MASPTAPEEQGDPNERLAAEWAAMTAREEAPSGADEDAAQALASEWAAIIGEDDLGAGTQPPATETAPGGGRVLTQDEIDSLLGFDSGEKRGDHSGVHLLVNSNEITYERLPMLEVVFDRLERIMTTSLRNFTSENVDISLENITAQRFGDYLNSVPLPAMIAVFRAIQWDNYGLITIDSSMIYAIVDVLLGGRRGTAPMRIEGRPYTTIETTLVERLVRLVLSDLQTAFQPIVPVEFRFERIETNPRFAAIARPGNACVVFKMRIELEDRGGTVEFLLPYATLEPARDILLQMFLGEKFGRDTIWEGHLTEEIRNAEVTLEVILDETVMTLGEVLAFREGTLLPLNVRSDSLLTIRCGSVPLLRGRAGRVRSRLAVAIEERLLAGENA
ncbi:Flagellar motor switch protein FliM [bacterium HR40]|nr:Flagellar motor switch protein FliM [bacterium HR40]